MSVRIAKNYFGQTGNPFVTVGEFELKPHEIKIGFDVFASVECFEAGDEAMDNMRREFVLMGSAFAEFAAAHRDVLEAIRQQVLTIAGVAEGNWDLTLFHIQTTKYVLVVNAEKPDDRITRVKTAPEYHSIIAANVELVQNAITIAWTYGKANDQFLASLR